MELTLSEAEGAELLEVVELNIPDLSHEIAATDNAAFRAGLAERRERLESIAGRLREGGATA